jgi:DNA-binding protein YbaB
MTADPSWLAPGPASPEMVGAMRARMQELLGEYDKVRANLAAMRARLREAEASARSKDGGIELTVGPQGALRSLTIDPRAYRKLSPTELAGEILRLSEAATAEVRKQLRDVMAPFLPAGVSYEQVADGSVDPGQWAPERPLTAETFDQWWRTFGGRDGLSRGGPGG